MKVTGVPYASVILPTLNRDSTLPFALASVQAQSQQSIEILVVLDGATPACRDVAVAAAKHDSRIRVLDLPKAPRSGGANNDFAVKQAAADRVFYIDDDDLFLPTHVESLGRLLDDADIADSRLCSADRSGTLNLGVACGSSEPVRRLLGNFRLKMLYDTHVAHRKDAHGRFSKWVPDAGEGNRPVWEFFSGFARAPACRWASIPDVTAINLHGAARRDMSPAARAAEIARWSDRVQQPTALAAALASADAAFNLFRLLQVDRPGPDGLAAYLAARGGYADVGSRSIERALFALFCGVLADDAAAIDVAVKLSEPVESGYLFEGLGAIFVEVYGPEQATRLLQAASLRGGDNPASRLAAFASALAVTDPVSALAFADEACAIGPDPVGSLAAWRDRLQQHLVARAQA